MLYNKFIQIFLVLFFLILPIRAFSQYAESVDSSETTDFFELRQKTEFHYTVGSSFTYLPRYGSITGLTVSPFLRYPVTPKFSVEAGLIAGRFYPRMKNSLQESGINNSFNSLAVFGSANYQLNKRLSIYGTGIRQLAGAMPLYNLPTSSFSFGSSLNFGNFTVGAEIRVSDWSNPYTDSPFGRDFSNLSSYPW